jgi:hypothetical protein
MRPCGEVGLELKDEKDGGIEMHAFLFVQDVNFIPVDIKKNFDKF